MEMYIVYALAETIIQMTPPPTSETRPSRHEKENPLKYFLVAFLIAIGIYLVSYQFIEHRRNRKGPWQVTFTNNVSGDPQVVINQPFIPIKNVRMTFRGVSMPANNGATLLFDQPKPVPYEVPFGTCVFMDTTFLPGTATFRFFGHEIELLPRVLIIDHEEHKWIKGSEITLANSNHSVSIMGQ